ncbi:GNAT family N-acetyltransferase [Methanoculleus sp. 10]|uniref:GNAT family N-acetyltransferase n=1 Tax=Methanoculleus sp. 10 TaxID=430615 RepID=UPI0025CE0A64|nr:GNAT family N-acetyltransferase [Methanoculleus sp. 10]
MLRDARIHVLIIPQTGGGGLPLFLRLLVPTDLAALAPEVRSVLEEPAEGGTAVLLRRRRTRSPGTEQEAGDRLALLTGDLSPAGREESARWSEPGFRRGPSAPWQMRSAPLRSSSRASESVTPGKRPLGSVTSAVVGCVKPPVLVLAVPIHLVEARGLRRDEFALAEEVWTDYHQPKADPEMDRIFGVFADDTLVSVARCRRHPDGYEVDGVFTRSGSGKGYARKAMDALVEACQHDTLYMHSVRNLVDFYAAYGFVSIPESALPPTIRARFAFALGEMEGANVQPMRRAGPVPAGAARRF